MSFSKFTKQDFELIDKAYASLREKARARCANDKEFEVVSKAFEFANQAHKNVRRRSGEPYMIHPIAVAEIVIDDIGLGYKSISAALLHDVVEDTEYTVEDIKNLFGEKIASLVDGLTKIKTVLDNEDKKEDSTLYSESVQAENFKRILLTLNDDVRVVLIKLADRLHNCRTIEYMPEHKRDKILSETMFIFIPLAHRLGLYEVKSEMENIWLKFKEPDVYKEINDKVNADLEIKKKEIDEFITPIQESLEKAGFNFEIKRRLKSPYSVWHKMQTKNVTYDQVYDLYAVRVVFTPDENSNESERDQCYHIFSIVTGLYRYQPNRVRDWVKHPKTNGYEALHCTLMSQFGAWVELQIRSKRMDDIAEKGIAAHWAYKKDGYIDENDNEMDKWLAKVKEIIMSKDFNALELLDIIHNDLTTGEIVVFTPKGEQRTIDKGATALDFAYQIHTEIGDKAIAAKVNMKLVPLSHVLKSGDQVEIITAQSVNPKREWLHFLQTRKAINRVVDYFRDFRDDLILEGARIFKEELERIGVSPSNENVKKILDVKQLLYIDELYFRVALGLVKVSEFEDIFKKQETPVGTPLESYIIQGTDDTGCKYVIASCCSPIPGDPVIGFKGPDGSITVHKKSCKVAESIASKHGDLMVVPHWSSSLNLQSFPVKISIKGLDRVGILNEISKQISLNMGVNMRKIYLGSEEGIFDGYIEFLIQDKNYLEELISKLNSIDGVQSVIRTDL